MRRVGIPNGYKINATISVYVKPRCYDLYTQDICMWEWIHPVYEVSYVTASRILVRLCLRACLIYVISFISIRVLCQHTSGFRTGVHCSCISLSLITISCLK